MKRDMELVRELLLRLESVDNPDRALMEVGFSELHIEGYTPQQILYHFELLHEGGLIECDPNIAVTSTGLLFRGLTWEGHDFLDSVRDPTIWRETKEGARKAGGYTIDVIVSLAKAIVKQQIAKHTGLQV